MNAKSLIGELIAMDLTKEVVFADGEEMVQVIEIGNAIVVTDEKNEYSQAPTGRNAIFVVSVFDGYQLYNQFLYLDKDEARKKYLELLEINFREWITEGEEIEDYCFSEAWYDNCLDGWVTLEETMLTVGGE